MLASPRRHEIRVVYSALVAVQTSLDRICFMNRTELEVGRLLLAM